MAAVTDRPFPCGDSTFINYVLEGHKKTSAAHDNMIIAFSGDANPAPYIYTYSEHNIPTDCNAHYVRITFNPESISNADINVEFVDWPQDADYPQSVSGEVYYSLVFFNGIRNRKGAVYLEMRKAIEQMDEGSYVTVVVKGFDDHDNNVYHGNVTSMHPTP